MNFFVEFITSTILRNFIFGFEKAYESHVQKLTICSLQKKLIAWLQNLYTHSTLKFYTQAIIIEYKKLFTTIF